MIAPIKGFVAGLLLALPLASGSAVTPTANELKLTGVIEQGGVLRGQIPPGLTSLTLDGKPVPVSSDGQFVIGFDRDAGLKSVLTGRLADGSVLRRDLAVQPRAWRIESLPTLRRGTSPSPEFLARRNRELAQINAARARKVESDGWRQRMIWPAIGRISGVFGSQRIYAGVPGSYHNGVDIARPTGTPVVAPADGVIILAAHVPFSLEGKLLLIDHGMGLSSAFLHLSRIDVAVGDSVRQGQTVGAIGSTGRSTGPHLHWGLRLRDSKVDPQTQVLPMPPLTFPANRIGQ
jgi:murein DD-endopeptidase MepM/ murein hydrolase activator NlpD